MNTNSKMVGSLNARRETTHCWICNLRDMLGSWRDRHRAARITPDRRNCTLAFAECSLPTPSDFYNGELEAAVIPVEAISSESIQAPLRHDDPQELTRARRVFALTWLIPLLAISVALWAFPAAFDQSMTRLLNFSQVASTVPLLGSLLSAGWRMIGRQGS